MDTENYFGKNIKKIFKIIRFRAFDFGPVVIEFDGIFSSKAETDLRIERLSEIKTELQSSIKAVEQLESDAIHYKEEVSKLSQDINSLKTEKKTVEQILAQPESALTNIFTKATSKSRRRGIIEGLVIGLVTGLLSSYIVWWLTTTR